MAWDREERLRQLRRVVEDAPDERFDMRKFTSAGWACGTVHCAAGWAAVDRGFQEHTEILDIFGLVPASRRSKLCYVVPKDDGTTFDSLAEMFGLSDEDATQLFGGLLRASDLPVPKSRVIANIDRLLAGLPAEPY